MTTIVLKMPKLAEHARKIANACRCSVVPRAVKNPATYGLTVSSRWSIVRAEGARAPVADIYAVSEAQATRVARLLANVLGVPLAVLDSDRPEARRKFVSNPGHHVSATTLATGYLNQWRRLKGGDRARFRMELGKIRVGSLTPVEREAAERALEAMRLEPGVVTDRQRKRANPKGRVSNPSKNEAQVIAERLWGEKSRPRFGGYGAAINGLGGEVMMGVVRSDGTWAGYYKGKSWRTVINRAMRNTPYDGGEQPRTANPRRTAKNARRRMAHQGSVVNIFGRKEWDRLTLNEVTAVLKDVGEIADSGESGRPSDDGWAAFELRRRIGGPANLKSYAQSLVAGNRHLNPSRSKAARARRRGVVSHRQRRAIRKAQRAGSLKSPQARYQIVSQIRRGTKRGLPHGVRPNPKGRNTAATLVARLKKNADDYHTGRITHAVFATRNLTLWKSVERAGVTVKRGVLARLRVTNPRRPLTWFESYAKAMQLYERALKANRADGRTNTDAVMRAAWAKAKDDAGLGRPFRANPKGRKSNTRQFRGLSPVGEALTRKHEAATIARLGIGDAFEDWRSGRAYIDNAGNYRLKASTAYRAGARKYTGRGRVAPWNRAVKRAFASVDAFHTAAMAARNPKGPYAQSRAAKPVRSHAGAAASSKRRNAAGRQHHGTKAKPVHRSQGAAHHGRVGVHAVQLSNRLRASRSSHSQGTRVANQFQVATRKRSRRAVRPRLAAGVSRGRIQTSTRRLHSRRVTRSGRKANPTNTELKRAVSTFHKWQDRKVRPALTTMRHPDPPLHKVGAELGELVSLTYRTDKYNGRTTDYEHDFKPPFASLVTDPAGKGLHVVRNRSRYKITSDGLVN